MNKQTASTSPTPPKAVKVGPMGNGPGGPVMQGGEKARDFKTTMKSLLHYVRPFWISIALVMVFAIASTVFAIASPKILGHMTNQVVSDYVKQASYDKITDLLPDGTKLPAGSTGADLLNYVSPTVASNIPADNLETIKTLDVTTRPTFDFGKLRFFALELVILYLLSSVLSYIQGWIMTDVSQKITYRFRRDISTKINRLPLRYFDSQTHGEVLSRITNDVDTINQTLNQSLTQIVTSVTMIIGILAMMFSISWQMTLVALITLPLSFLLIGVIVKRSQRYFKEQQDSLGAINGHIEEMYSGHNVMRAYNGEKESISIFNTINTKLYSSGWKSQFFSGLMMPLMTFVGNLSYVGVSVVGGYLAVKGRIQIGDIQAFIQYVNQFNQPIIQTANIANVLQSTAASAERVFEFLAEKEEVPETSQPVVLERVRGTVEFDKVVFGYSPEKEIIHGFDAHLKPGSKIAIVGPTGAGKTTIVNLLMRFYDVTSGSIKIDGVDIRDMKRADLRRMFGMVLQDTWLFKGTIRENIAYGQQSATQEEIVNAAKAAHVDHFVHSLPHGYDMEIDEEANNLSQGEKQLLTIARAMLADPPMLILDEATSSVDTRTEVLIQKAMANLMHGRTSFVIAHRLSTIRDADVILVMKDGNIIEQGTHEKLLEQKGFYASLYNSQFAHQAA